jgi:SIR2-like protein
MDTTATAPAPLQPGQVDSPQLTAVANHVKKESCILFLGAGVHRPAPAGSPFVYTEQDAPPTGRALAAVLAAKSEYERALPGQDPTNLARVTTYYDSTLGRPDLVRDIQSAVRDNRTPSPALKALAKLNFPVVITTNYDNLFEDALAAVGKRYTRCVYSPNDAVVTTDLRLGDISGDAPFVLKIHGDVTDAASLVVTEDDYIQFVLRMGDKEQVNPIPSGVRFALKSWPTLFIGYSLNDYNLRLLFKTMRWKVDRSIFPMSYAVDPSPDPLIRRVMAEGPGRQIVFIAEDVWTFVPTLYRLVYNAEMAP